MGSPVPVLGMDTLGEEGFKPWVGCLLSSVDHAIIRVAPCKGSLHLWQVHPGPALDSNGSTWGGEMAVVVLMPLTACPGL